ncbi:hypothetical protein [Nonlabens ponticola]|uniref:Tryptophan-rich sensory protein n=1 Tax=Nonlabens ponticola TaxID=2496866 RepID=A0A3S9MVZ6_9FLAO|nr:hypothetical protein [Nonlabens ponticola]AZQ43395.1 hypothetical protein EJ995_03775 [Nonlabens ponticola]
MLKKIASILNLISIIVLIAWNGYANSGNFNGNTVGDLSAEYSNLFTPASYAFAIWGLIFLMLLVFGVYGVYYAFAKATSLKPRAYRTNFVVSTAPWFLLANICCTAWVGFWLEEMIGISVLLMVGILVFLLLCVRSIDMELWDAPFPLIAFVWWPLCLYTGWISVAIIANVASYLNEIMEFTRDQEIYITIAMVVVAAVINILMVWYRNMREYASVGVWALVAIYVRHKDEVELISYVAIAAAAILLVNIMWHGYLNRHTNPFIKYKQYRASKA